MDRYKASLLVVLGIAALCFATVPMRACSPEVGHVGAR